MTRPGYARVRGAASEDDVENWVSCGALGELTISGSDRLARIGRRKSRYPDFCVCGVAVLPIRIPKVETADCPFSYTPVKKTVPDNFSGSEVASCGATLLDVSNVAPPHRRRPVYLCD